MKKLWQFAGFIALAIVTLGASFPYVTLNNKTNRLSDNGAAFTRNGVAIGGGGGIAGTVSNNVASAGLLAVDASKTNGISATAAHITNAWGIFTGDTTKAVSGAGTLIDVQSSIILPTDNVAIDTTYATAGTGNIAIGKDSATNNANASDTIAIGNSALQSIVNGFGAVVIGSHALQNGSGSYQVIIGPYAGNLLPPGNDFNTIVGAYAAQYAAGNSHDLNIVGEEAFGSLLDGSWNEGLGAQVFYGLITGDDNIGIGESAGAFVTNGFKNIFIGSYADSTVKTITNSIAIGYSAKTTNDNDFVIGGTLHNYRFPGASMTITGPVTNESSITLGGVTRSSWPTDTTANWIGSGTTNSTLAGAANVNSLVSTTSVTAASASVSDLLVGAMSVSRGTLTHGANVTIDFASTNRYWSCNLTGNVTFVFANVTAGKWANVLLRMPSTNCTPTFPMSASTTNWLGGAPSTLTGNTIGFLSFYPIDATTNSTIAAYTETQ